MNLFNSNKLIIVTLGILAGVVLANKSVWATDDECGNGIIQCHDAKSGKLVGTIPGAFTCHTSVNSFNFTKAEVGKVEVCEKKGAFVPFLVQCLVKFEKCREASATEPVRCVATPVCDGPLGKWGSS